jgi:mannosyltransferase OCH1-like enzyme
MLKTAYDRYKDNDTIIYAECHTASCLSGTHLLIRELWQAIKQEVERQEAHEKAWEADKERFVEVRNAEG